MNRVWKVGFIITSEVCEEINREESVYIDDKKRPWLKKTPKKLIAEDVNIDEGTDKRATSGDVSTAMYVADKYKNVKVDIISPHEITRARLKQNDVNFIILYDLLESFHTALPGTTHKISKILNQCDNVYPSNKMMRCINYKQNYYKYMQKHGVPIATFKVLHRKDWVKLTDHEKIDKIKKLLRGMKGWSESFVTKPVFGQESMMVKVFNKAYSKEYIASYVDSTMKLYPGVIFQEYMRNMATKECCEFRCYFVGDKFAYCVITNDEGEYIHKAEGGRKEFAGYAQAVKLAHKAIKKVPQSKMKGITLPRLMTRIDVGTAVKRNTKIKEGNRVLFVSEVELVPSLFIEITKKQPDVLLGDQIMKILATLDKTKE